MPAADWKTLLANLQTGACVPFLGAGACIPLLPTGAALAAEVLTRAALDPPYPFEERTNLARVTQYVASVWNDVPRTKHLVAEVLHERVEKAKSKDGSGLPPIHKCLAQLRLPVYITTNYDDLLEQALAGIPGVRPRSEICRWSEELLAEDSGFDDGKYQPSPASTSRLSSPRTTIWTSWSTSRARLRSVPPVATRRPPCLWP
jgi:hypothetical protein